MKFLHYLLIFIFLMQISNGIIINEIMADPIADEPLNEWIELYNNESISINVSDWIIGDDNDNDIIEGGLYNKQGTIIEPFGFAIITDDATRVYNNFNVSDTAIRLYVDDSSIGNGLSNDGKTIYLYDKNGNLIHKVTYNKTKEGLTWAYLNGSLHKSNPTPGFSNDGSIVEEYCDYQIELILAKTMFENSSEFSFKIRASKVSGLKTNFTATASIEDLNGKLIKEYKPFTNDSITNQRTSTEYTPNLEEGKSYIINTDVTVECNDTNLKNNFDTRIITIKGKPLQEESSIDIANIYDLGTDKKAKFGQTIRIKLNAYKGNTNKASVAVWVEDKKGNKLSKQSKTNLDQKYTNYSLTLPVQIKPNCDESFKDGDYTIIAQGLDTEDEEEVEIEDLTDSMCEIKTIEAKTASSKKFGFELEDFNENIELNKKFTTKILFNNDNDADMDIKLWSYVYRGSKCYSGDREENMKEFVLKANSLDTIELSNIVADAEPGDYKFKVLVNKDNQKTNNEITKDVVINENGKAEKIDVKSIDDIPDSIKNNIILDYEKNRINNNVITDNYGLVYESTTEKAKSLIPFFIIILSILLNIILIWRR